MNESQKAYANIDPKLGRLLNQIDVYYQSLPAAVQEAFDQLSENVKYACYCDLLKDETPDDCVINTGRLNDCIHAKENMHPNECEHWRPYISILPLNI